MNTIDLLVEQCKKPKGLLGIIMLRIMNIADVGLTNGALKQINCDVSNVLDIGCGGGKTINLLSKRYPKSKIYGIDYSAIAVNTAIKKNKHKVSNGSIIISQASVSSMPFANGFSTVLLLSGHIIFGLT